MFVIYGITLYVENHMAILYMNAFLQKKIFQAFNVSKHIICCVIYSISYLLIESFHMHININRGLKCKPFKLLHLYIYIY